MPTAAAVPAFDAALTELAAKFERLLDEYCARRRVWGPRLAQTHAETDELFGEIWNSDDKEDRTKFFEEACARLNVRDADDRMYAVGKEMMPLARDIVASPATSMEALRAKCWSRSGKSRLCLPPIYHFDFDDEFTFSDAVFCGRRILRARAQGHRDRLHGFGTAGPL